MAPLAARRTAPGGSSETQTCDALGKVENGTLKKRSENTKDISPDAASRGRLYGQQLPSR